MMLQQRPGLKSLGGGERASSACCKPAPMRMPMRPAVLRSVNVVGASKLGVSTSRGQPRTSRTGPQQRTSIISASATSTIALPGTQRIAAAGGPVIVYGAQGLTGIALVKGLLEQGQRVVAGVQDLEAAKATVAFAERFELLDKKALSNLQLRQVAAGDASGLPRGGKFVIIEGDAYGGSRTDARFVQGGLATAEAAGASKVVLATSESAKGGTFFFFGGNNNTPNKDLTRTEKQVEASGIPAVIVRASTTEQPTNTTPGPLQFAAGPGALAPAAAPISKAQLAEIVSAALSVPSPPPGAAMVVEAAGGKEAPEKPIKAVLSDALDAAQAKTPVATTKQAAPAPQGSTIVNPLSALGTVSMRKGRAAASADSDDGKDAEKDGGTSPIGTALTTIIGTISQGTGTTKAKPAPKPAPKPAAQKPSAARISTTFTSKAAAPAKAASAPVKAPPPKPAPKPAPQPAPVKKAAPPPPPKRSPTPPAAAKAEPKEEKKPAGGGLLGFLGLGAKPKQVDEEPKAAQKASAAKAPPPKPQPVKKAAPPPPKASPTSKRSTSQDEEEPKKPSGLAALFGLGGSKPKKEEGTQSTAKTGTSKTQKVAPPSRGTVSVGTSKQAPKAAPPKPAPKPAAKPAPPPPKPAPKPAAKPAPKAPTKTGTNVSGLKGTIKPVSGFSVPPKKK